METFQFVGDYRVVAVLPTECGLQHDAASEEACLAKLATKCKGFKPSCYTKALARSQPCRDVMARQHGDSGYKSMFAAAFRRAEAQLRKLGWQHFAAVHISDPSLNSSLAMADVIILLGQHYQQLHLPEHLPASKRGEKWAIIRSLDIPDVVLQKVVALMPHVWLWRFPLECGGKPKYLSFMPFFRPDLGSWDPPALAGRQYDVAFMGSLRSEGTPVYYHRLRAQEELLQLKQEHPELRVTASEKSFNYEDYLGRLRDVKILVSPYGYGEYALRDYEGWLSGAVVIKPRSDHLLAYPDLYKPLNTVYSVNVNFTDLRQTVMHILDNLDEAQKVVQRAQDMLRKYADPGQFARDFDKLLRQTLQL
ncbi:hypothetical protein WJX72_012074 [[Myrmecia] bisecta]|uniref:Glycosyltransferase family 1 protein n=1 Tax=[Myrmecia] bisecta TaxID=41462 RepID=A0AAW1PZ06_9CHLO